MKPHIIILLILLFYLTGCISPRPSLPPLDVSPSELVSDYEKDLTAADEKYKGRTLNITGDVANVVQIRESIGIFFEDYNSASTLNVVCASDRSQANLMSDLKRGQSVKVSGTGEGKVSDYVINIGNCKIK